MWKVFGATLLLIIIVAGLTLYRDFKTFPTPNISVPTETTTSTEVVTETLPLEVIAKNLEVPWALVFLPDKSILVTERSGKVRLIDKDGRLSAQSTIEIAEVKNIGEGGLHGITIHPDFSTNHFVYLYYTYGRVGLQTLNRVARFVFDGNNLIDQTIIVDKIPGAMFHDGGRIKFGPDNFLYITTGDAQEPSLAQDKNSLAGKILRVTDDGKLAPGNPFGNLVYSYGHRNPQGITWDNNGRLWATEHGSSATDELNLIEVGKNYGWPTIKGDQKKEGMVSPILHSGSDTWAPAGAAFYNGSIYFGGLRGQALYQFKVDTSELKTHFKGQFGRIRDVVLGPDNMLYITTSNRDGRSSPTQDDDKIIRINPQRL